MTIASFRVDVPLTDTMLHRLTDEILRRKTADFRLLIDSPGGPTSTSLALRVLLRTAAVPIQTVCIGRAIGGAALLLASGAPGRRALLPRARICLGHPVDREDAKTQALDDVVLDDPMFFHELALATGADRDALERLGDGRWLSAHEAVELGFADRVIERVEA